VNKTDRRGLDDEYETLCDLYDHPASCESFYTGPGTPISPPPDTKDMPRQTAAQRRNQLRDQAHATLSTFLASGPPCERYLSERFGSGGGSVRRVIEEVGRITYYDTEVELTEGRDLTIANLDSAAEHGGMLVSDWQEKAGYGATLTLKTIEGTILNA
jgi:hypothetical protein